MTSKPASEGAPERVGDGDMTSATFGYLGAIVLGPVIPLLVYALRARRSPFMRYHAATAVNLSLTGLLYGLCCLILGGLLLLDNITVALVVVLAVGFVIWVSMLQVSHPRRDRGEPRRAGRGAQLDLRAHRELRARSACASRRRPGGGRGG